MPPVNAPLKSQTLTDNVLQSATVAAGALRDISGSSQVPFLHTVSTICFIILSNVQAVKVNKQGCLQMVEQINELLWAIVNLCVNSNTGDVLPPSILHNIGDFAQTLQKIHSYVEGQLKMGKIKRFFRQGESSQQLDECKTGLQHAVELFSVQTGATTMAGLVELRKGEEAQYNALLELVSARTATISSGNVSSSTGFSNFGDSSSSLSVLPAVPKIFYGRDSELQEAVELLLRESARIAILGSGGIGKSSLATAVIHHSDIVGRYPRRCFVTCDSATTHTDLVSIVGSHLELEPSQNMTKVIFRHLSNAPPTLLVLDNLETPWEPLGSRSQVEEFLSLLTDIPHVALLVTMRGAERPGKVRWTRPFLPPLKPLTYSAARQTFLDIADDTHNDAEIDELLRLTDHLPLAVNLIANVVSFEGSATALLRWKKESTMLISEGYDKRSNLDMSITLSISSPRMLSTPNARDLLSVISLLPDGISEADLLQSALPIREIERCKVALIRTSLAYLDRDGCLKVLGPIREYVLNIYPPPLSLVRPIRNHLYEVLMLWKTYRQISPPDCIPRILANLGNFNSVLLWGLNHEDKDLEGTIQSILTLDPFTRAINRGPASLMQHVPNLLERCDDHRLHGEYITTIFESYEYKDVVDANGLEMKGIQLFKSANDPLGEVQLYNVIGSFYLIKMNDRDTALKYFNRALPLAIEIGDTNGQTKALMHLAEVEWQKGDYRTGREYAQQARRAAQSTGHLMAEAHTIEVEVLCLYSLGDVKRSVELCTKARELLTACGMRGGALESSIMGLEGDIHFLKTEYAESRLIHTQILDRTSKDRSPIEHAYAFLNIAFVDSAIGAEERVVRENLDAARALFTSLNSPGGICFCDIVTADLQLCHGLKTEPQFIYERCLLKYRGRADVGILCLEKLGDPTHGMSDMRTTLGYACVLFGFAKKSRSLSVVYSALRCLGDIFFNQGDEHTASDLFVVALDGFTAMDIHRSRADCMLRLGDIAKARGQFIEARSLWNEARPLYERSSQAKSIALIDERLGK